MVGRVGGGKTHARSARHSLDERSQWNLTGASPVNEGLEKVCRQLVRQTDGKTKRDNKPQSSPLVSDQYP